MGPSSLLHANRGRSPIAPGVTEGTSRFFVVPTYLFIIPKMLELPEILDTYSCSQCSHSTASVFQLNNHVQRNHKNVFATELFHAIVEPQQLPCTHCDYKSYYQFELYEHCKQLHNLWTGNNKNATFCEMIERYPCEHCKFKSDSSLSLVIHNHLCEKEPTRDPQDATKEPEGMESRELTESVARRTIRDVRVMESNISMLGSRGKTYLFQCNHCSYQSKFKSKLKAHMMSKQDANEEINWFQCNHCSYRSKLKSYLNKHMLKHAANEEINWFQCNHCSYRAKRTDNLKVHMLSHAANEEINWFQCNHCSYRAKRMSHLKSHMLIHAANEEINWFQCSHCSHRSKSQSELRKHMMFKHTANEEINWFQCYHCSYRAKRKSHLREHMMSKHTANEEINWFQCKHCSHRAKQKSNLKRHMMRKHYGTNVKINI